MARLTFEPARWGDIGEATFRVLRASPQYYAKVWHARRGEPRSDTHLKQAEMPDILTKIALEQNLPRHHTAIPPDVMLVASERPALPMSTRSLRFRLRREAAIEDGKIKRQSRQEPTMRFSGTAPWRLAGLLLLLPAGVHAGGPGRVDFNRQIRPILSESCYQCHGPDVNKRKADLRLDLRDGLFRSVDGTTVVVPGKPDESELFVPDHDRRPRAAHAAAQEPAGTLAPSRST